LPVPGEPSGDIQAANTLQVFDDAGMPSGLVIKTTDPFKVAMEFEFLSPTVKALLGALSFEVKYFAETIGPGPEYNLGTVAKQTVTGQATYNATKPAGSETILDIPPKVMDPGVYRLAALVTFRLAGPNTTPKPYGMTAYCEGPPIEVYAP
jgi:hypothetical protein